MSLTTEEVWELDGVALNTLAFNIESLGGDREGPPPVRGNNLLIPLRPGRIWAERFPDERIISLGMWVIGATEDGGVPAHGDVRRQFRENWQKLYALFYTPWRQGTLTKTWRDPLTNDLKSASAQVNYGGGLEEMSKNNPGRGTFAVDLVLAEPYFYDDVESSWTLDSPGQTSKLLTNDSSDIHRKLTITMEAVGGNVGIETIGDRYGGVEREFNDQYIVLENTTPDPSVWFGFRTSLVSGQKIELDTLEYKARRIAGPGTIVNWTGLVANGGTRHWMLLLPGQQSLKIWHGGGGGTLRATVTYRDLHF